MQGPEIPSFYAQPSGDCSLLLESAIRLISWTAFSSTALLASARIQNSFVLEHEDLF